MDDDKKVIRKSEITPELVTKLTGAFGLRARWLSETLKGNVIPDLVPLKEPEGTAAPSGSLDESG